MSANASALRALQGLATGDTGMTPVVTWETGSGPLSGLVVGYDAKGNAVATTSPEQALAAGRIGQDGYQGALADQPKPAAPPPIATSIPVGEPDLSRVPGGGASSLPGGVLHAMTGAGLPQMPEPAPTPAPREFQPLAGAAPQGGGIPEAVRAYVAQQPSGLSQDEKDLADAQEQQRRLQLFAGLGHAGATIGAAIGRIPVDEGFWHDLSRQTGRPVEELRQMQAVRQIQAAKDPASEENKRAREAYAALMPEVAQQPGWNAVTKADIPAFLSDARFRQQMAERAKAHGEAQSMDEARLAETKRHNLVNESRPVGVPQGAAAEKPAQFVAPGYTLTPGAKPSNFELGKFREALAARDQILEDVKALREMYAKHGTEIAGDVARRMDTRVSDLKLKVKDLAALGALSGSDLELLKAQIPDPTSVGSNIKGAVGLDTTPAGLDEFSKIINNALDSKRDALGIVPVSGGASAAGLNLDAPEGDTVRVVSPNGKTGTIPKAKLQDALNRGFRLVSP